MWFRQWCKVNWASNIEEVGSWMLSGEEGIKCAFSSPDWVNHSEECCPPLGFVQGTIGIQAFRDAKLKCFLIDYTVLSEQNQFLYHDLKKKKATKNPTNKLSTGFDNESTKTSKGFSTTWTFVLIIYVFYTQWTPIWTPKTHLKMSECPLIRYKMTQELFSELISLFWTNFAMTFNEVVQRWFLVDSQFSSCGCPVTRCSSCFFVKCYS